MVYVINEKVGSEMMRDWIEDHLLGKVEKPLRYQGNEMNAVHKDWDSTTLRLVFGFPDIYEIGMSHLGLSILYHQANSHPDYLMERVFAPWVDMEGLMRENGIPLFSLESYRPVKEFHGLAFTLQYEMSYSNILNMLDLAGIPLRWWERSDADPLIFVGGPCAYNPEPLADFVDVVLLGEGEEMNMEFYQVWAEHLRAHDGKMNKKELLDEVVKIPGVYIPRFYDVAYDEAGHVTAVVPNHPDAPEKLVKRYLQHMDNAYFPENPIVPYLDVIHDRAMLEVQRGCTRGCRFCQAGMLYRPVREKTVEELQQQARAILCNTGHNDLSLTSLSTSDYTSVDILLRSLIAEMAPKNISVSLPSLRVDNFSMNLANEMQKGKKTGLTFAPEAGTQRLRDVINKGVLEANLESVARMAFGSGWSKIKLYFMMGLPTETDEDLDGIAALAYKVLQIGDEVRRENGGQGPAPQVTVSVSGFVPKPFTPFQFEPQIRGEELRRRQRYLRDKIKHKRVTYHYHDSQVSYIEAIFAKGDRRLGKVLYRAWEKGCKFDGWGEYFYMDWWMEAFAECGLDPEFYAYRKIPYEEILPWDHISCGVRKSYLIREHQKAMRAEVTQDCRVGTCHGCGVCQDLDVQLDLKGGWLRVNTNAVLQD